MARRKPNAPAPLAAGNDAWCLLVQRHRSRSRSPGKITVLGVARVRVIAVDGAGVHRVHVLETSPREDYMVGRELEYPRTELYPVRDRAAMDYFRDLVTALWSRKPAERDAAAARVWGGS